MTTTIPDTQINQPVTGYVVNTLLDIKNQQSIREIQDTLVRQLGSSVWVSPADSLHITLLDWIAPLVEYSTDKDQLFTEIYPRYNAILRDIFDKQPPFTLTFQEIRVSPSAIYIVSDNDGEFNHIRQQFLESVTLLDGTKQPPKIVHSTIARFTENIDVDIVQDVLDGLSIDSSQSIAMFQLVKEVVSPMMNYEVIEEYNLRESTFR